MAAYYQTEFVPEVAREIVSSNDFSLDDIVRIAKAQNERVKEKMKTANRFLFCDTDLITTQIYCRHYLKTVPSILYEFEKEIKYDQYFLFDIDVPWVADGLRDLGTKRMEMFQTFEMELSNRKICYQLVTGTWGDREKAITKRLAGRKNYLKSCTFALPVICIFGTCHHEKNIKSKLDMCVQCIRKKRINSVKFTVF